MWPFIPGERFPYANFHAMNQDWILSVVKEFQQNYSTIQEAITQGNAQLQQTYNHLTELLNLWYTSHSEDIAEELTQAIADFTSQARQIGLEVLSTIPQDYSNLSTSIELSNKFVASTVNEGWIYRYQNGQFVRSTATGLGQTAPITAAPGSRVIIWNATGGTDGYYITFLDDNDIDTPLSIVGATPTKQIAGGSYYEFIMPENVYYFSAAIVLNRGITIYIDNNNSDELNRKAIESTNRPEFNIFDKRMSFSGWYYYWSPTSGITKNVESWAANSHVINVEPGDTLTFYGVTPLTTNRFSIIYHNTQDINDTSGGYQVQPFKHDAGGSYYRFVVPSDVHFISFGFAASRANSIKVFKDQKPYNAKMLTVNALGDSITRGHISSGVVASPTWCETVANKLNCTVNNYGVNAASICNGETTLLSILQDMPETWIDSLVIFAGTNDYGDGRAYTIGSINDEPQQGTNFTATFKNLILTAINKYPMAQILIATPLRRRIETANSRGITLKDIVDAEKNVAAFYGMPVIDLYNTCGLNPSIDAQRTAYTADGLHPNQDGINLFLSPKFTEAIRKTLTGR